MKYKNEGQATNRDGEANLRKKEFAFLALVGSQLKIINSETGWSSEKQSWLEIQPWLRWVVRNCGSLNDWPYSGKNVWAGEKGAKMAPWEHQHSNADWMKKRKTGTENNHVEDGTNYGIIIKKMKNEEGGCRWCQNIVCFPLPPLWCQEDGFPQERESSPQKPHFLPFFLYDFLSLP